MQRNVVDDRAFFFSKILLYKPQIATTTAINTNLFIVQEMPNDSIGAQTPKKRPDRASMPAGKRQLWATGHERVVPFTPSRHVASNSTTSKMFVSNRDEAQNRKPTIWRTERAAQRAKRAQRKQKQAEGRAQIQPPNVMKKQHFCRKQSLFYFPRSCSRRQRSIASPMRKAATAIADMIHTSSRISSLCFTPL